MVEEGKLLTCDRCGLTLFVCKSGTQFNVIDGYCEESPTYQDSDPNWGYLSIYPKSSDIPLGLKTVFTCKLLCPKCRDEFADLMHKFWRIVEV